MNRGWTAVGAVSAGLAVAAGAFGAHTLKARFGPEALAIWETAARYHLVHALALLAVAQAASTWRSPAVRAAGWCLLVGTVLFSLTGVRALGAITPLGGAAFIAGWGCLAWAALRGR